MKNLAEAMLAKLSRSIRARRAPHVASHERSRDASERETVFGNSDSSDLASCPAAGDSEDTKSPVIALVDQINAVANAWNPDEVIPIVDALGNIAGKPINSRFDELPHTMFVSRHSSYSPWLRDQDLKRYFEEVRPPYLFGVRKSTEKGATIVDIYRCWTIWQIVTQLKKISGDFIEIGAFRGGTSALIAHGIATAGLDGHLFVCDTFEGVVKAGEHDNMYHGGEHAETSETTVSAVVATFLEPARFSIRRGIFPDETGDLLNGRTFCFAHIDVDVYLGTKESLEALWPLMSVGGVIVVDDYGLYGTEGVTKAVEEFAVTREDAMLIYNFNGQAILTKLAR